jgi:RNA polymerase sigma-70 factor (ECF subfamily)
MPTSGATRSVAELIQLHYQTMWRALRRLGVPSASAEDAAQEVFVIAARKLTTVTPGNEARYLYGIAVRVAANRRRTSAVRHEHKDDAALADAVSGAPLADALLERKQMRELLDLALDALPDDLRAALVLFELEGFSEREMAALWDVPLGTVASRLRRARAAFHREAEALRVRYERRGDSK